MLFKEIINQIKSNTASKATIKTLMILGVIAILAIWLATTFFNLLFPEFTQGMTIRIVRVVLFLGLKWLWDRFAIPEVNTIEVLKQGNIAYAIFDGCTTIGLAIVVSSI